MENYLTWKRNLKTRPIGKQLEATIGVDIILITTPTESVAIPAYKNSLALEAILRHLCEGLQTQYVTEDDPRTLWEFGFALTKDFGTLKTIFALMFSQISDFRSTS